MRTAAAMRACVAILAGGLLTGCPDDGGPTAGGEYPLRVFVSGPGSVTSSDGKINACTATSGTCFAFYAANSTVVLTAAPAAGTQTQFSGWAGTCSGSTAATCSISMSREREETAIFNPLATGGVGDVFGLTDNDEIFSFFAAAPGTLASTVAVTGILAAEDLVGIDFRPANGQLYGVARQGNTGRIYLINKYSRAATLVSTIGTALSGNSFAVDFDPAGDALRIVSDTGQSLLVDVVSGATDPPGSVPAGIVGAAYDNNIDGAAGSTLYVIDAAADRLLKLVGTATTPVGSGLGTAVDAALGFDIDSRTGTAYVAFAGATPMFGTIDLATGTLTGAQALAANSVRGLAVAIPPAPEVYGVRLKTLDNGTTQQTLVRFSASQPDVAGEIGAIGGLDAGDSVVGIDFRPANGVLHALGRGTDGSSQLYTLNLANASATKVGGRSAALTLAEGIFGMDFDPNADRIRVVSSTRQNLRIDPTTGTLSADATLVRAPLKPTGLAFDNSQQGGDSTDPTTLFAIDTAAGRLGKINKDTSDGRFDLVGSLGLTATQLASSDLNGFEIIGRSDTNPAPGAPVPDRVGLAAFSSGSSSVLYRVDLETGRAVAIGPIGPSGFNRRVVGIAAMPEDNPSNNNGQDVFAITEDLRLISFVRTNPSGMLTRDCQITGMPAGTVLAMDIRPEPVGSSPPGWIYAVVDGSPNALVRINVFSCAADAIPPAGAGMSRTLQAAPGSSYVDADLDGRKVGFDFDAAAGVFRMTTDAGKHFSVDPSTGLVTARAAIAERQLAIGGAAYSNGANPVLYDINLDATAIGPIPTLMTQEPTTGVLRDIGRLFPAGDRAVDNDPATPPRRAVASLDIFGPTNALALAVLRMKDQQGADEQVTRLFRVDLGTGKLDEVLASCVNSDCGGIGPRRNLSNPDPRDTRYDVTDIAVRFPPIP